MNNTMFTYNRAYYSGRSTSGGAVYISGTITFISKCQFINNRASGNGGGLFETVSSLTVTQTNFSNNIASGSGGGFYTARDNLSVIQSHFFYKYY